MKNLSKIIDHYLKHRPLFLSLIRSKEAYLFQKYLPLKRPILDLGCGDGFFAKASFDQQLDIGLDVLDSRIDQAKDVYKETIVYDGHTFPLKDNSVNTIVSNCMMDPKICTVG